MTNFVRAAAAAALLVAGNVPGAVAAPAAADANAAVTTEAGPVNVESLAKLDNPWGMTFLPDGRLLITEKPGRLRIFADGKLSEPVAGVPTVAYKGQGGLLDVEIDPDFKNNQFVYLSYAEPADPQPENARDAVDPRLGTFFKAEDHVLKGGAVARGRLDGDRLADVKVIWRQVPKTVGRGHFGGRIIFAPDGKMFITSGERQQFEPAQNPTTNLGAIVRINPDGSIPKDNPFADKQGFRPDLYTYGNRNPLGGAIHPESKKLWIHEMGPKGGDELNIIEPGQNYGWPAVAVEAAHYNDAPIPAHHSEPKLIPPVRAWTPVISPSGMIFYGGSKFSAWKGDALIGGLSSKALVRVDVEGGEVAGDEKIAMGRRIRDVIEAPDGAVLVLSDGPQGELLRLTPASGSGK